MSAASEALRFDANGLIPAVVQEVETGEVLMVAWMNAEAVERTLVRRVGGENRIRQQCAEVVLSEFLIEVASVGRDMLTDRVEAPVTREP